MMKALEIKDLKKKYNNNVYALKGVNLEVKQGDFFALLGPNGAGKSTIIGIITSLINKSSGSIKVFGKDIIKNSSEAKSYIGVVPQELNFNTFEKVEQIILNQAGYYGINRTEAKIRAEKYLKELDLWEKKDMPSITLSGGMKRRLMIARALVHEPKLLILDEPTAGVDIEIRRSTWGFIKKLNQAGTTIILTTHYLEEAETLCKNIAIINKGKIIENTSMKKLLNKLNTEILVLDLKENLKTLPKLDEYNIKKIDDFCIEVEVSKKYSVNKLFEQLNKMGIEVLSLKNKSNRLEELFINLIEENEK